MTDNFEMLTRAISPTETIDLQVDSQSLSFSPCGNHLVIASRAARNGKVVTMVYDLQPLQGRGKRMPDLRSSVSTRTRVLQLLT